MFYINNQPIIASEIEVLQELKSQLALQGINRFEKFIETENHIQFNCPIHKNGQERSPSCGITKNRIITELGNGNKKVVESGTVHCFQCGYTTSLPEMISDCFGKNDMGIFGTQWLIKNFLTVSVQERKPLQLDLSRNTDNIKNQTTNFITEEELDSYRYIHPYMYKRKLTDEIINKFDVGYDKDFVIAYKDKKTNKTMEKHLGECITFPIRDINGNVLFIARRCINNKTFHYPNDAIKPVYGLYELYQLDTLPTELYVCESIIDCLTLWVHKKYAVALNGLGTDFQFNQLTNIPIRKLILATDADKAGMDARIRIKKNVKRKLFTEIILPEGRKDINECTYDEIENLMEKFI